MLLSAPAKANLFQGDSVSGPTRAKPEPDAVVAGRLSSLSRSANFVAPAFAVASGVGVVADAADGWSVAAGEAGSVLCAVHG